MENTVSGHPLALLLKSSPHARGTHTRNTLCDGVSFLSVDDIQNGWDDACRERYTGQGKRDDHQDIEQFGAITTRVKLFEGKGDKKIKYCQRNRICIYRG